jgi:hypothetical protein
MKKTENFNCERLENRLMMTADPIDLGLSRLYKYYYRDNELSRNEMVAILNNARDRQRIDAIEFNDLKNIISESNMPDYVRYFANVVVNGSPANNFFNGRPLGNLFAGASQRHMSNLINKWFMGKDHPTINAWKNNTSYQYVVGGLFVDGPSLKDIDQGGLGDCYLINALGAVAHSDPSAIDNMFIYNGDNTWTVRFINHRDNQSHYVTVDRYLPVNKFTGQARFASFGGNYRNPNNELWVSLAEKAYVQVSQIPGFRLNSKQVVNDYRNISGGFNSWAVHHIIGVRPQGMRVNNELSVIRNINQDKPMVIAIGNHAYTISSYNPQTRKFHIHNPWGHTHLELTWYEMRVRGITNKVAYVVNAKLSRPIS